MENIKINTEYIKLDSFLKFTGDFGSGVEAKFYILDGNVKVNGEKEIRRGKKLYKGDIVTTEFGEYNVC
ncbi:MAG: RNA-binding S4 domain-containing protein [Eubacteriales bacterium]|nr:RNA-binding S4 domain-containing protein [Eubacteriales bacterium]